MNFLGIVGSNKDESYAKKLLYYTNFLMIDEVYLKQIDLKDIPLFNRDLSIKNFDNLLEISEMIEESDGIILAYDQVNNSLASRLKSLLEWMSYEVHPFVNKPVLLLGVSEENQASLMAQMHLKEIFTSPGLEAFIMPGNDFLMLKAQEIFDPDGMLIDEISQDYLEHCIERFKKYADLVNKLELDQIESKYIITLKAGGYINLDDPYSDGTSGATDY